MPEFAVKRRVSIPLMGPGEKNAWGMYSMDRPTGEMYPVYKTFCPTCAVECYRKLERWYCPKCKTYFEGSKFENE